MTRPAFLRACCALLCTLAMPGAAAVQDLGDEPASDGLGMRRTPYLIARIPLTRSAPGPEAGGGS